jgi:hypothetical protein
VHPPWRTRSALSGALLQGIMWVVWCTATHPCRSHAVRNWSLLVGLVLRYHPPKFVRPSTSHAKLAVLQVTMTSTIQPTVHRYNIHLLPSNLKLLFYSSSSTLSLLYFLYSHLSLSSSDDLHHYYLCVNYCTPSSLVHCSCSPSPPRSPQLRSESCTLLQTRYQLDSPIPKA